MRFGIIAPTSNEYADARTLAELAHEAEEAGWDGFFIWDHILYDAQSMPPVVDTWIALTAIALRTTHPPGAHGDRRGTASPVEAGA